MQSSSSVIKNNDIKSLGSKKIEVEYTYKKKNIEKCEEKIENPYEKIGVSIIQSAKKRSSEIIENALKKVESIQLNAQKKGYDEGYQKGEEKGYNDGYERAIDEAKKEAEQIKDNSYNILKSAKCDYEKYLYEKSNTIKNLICNIVYEILKKEIENPSIVLNLIEDALKSSKNTKTFIIRCNSFYEEEIKKNIDVLKKSLGIKSDIFLISDDSIEKGIVIVDKNNGKIEFNINESMEKIKDIIMNS